MPSPRKTKKKQHVKVCRVQIVVRVRGVLVDGRVPLGSGSTVLNTPTGRLVVALSSLSLGAVLW